MFDPTLPQENTLADAAQMRSQLNSLKALIDAALGINAAQVDGTSTLPPGSAATVSVTVTGNTLHFTIAIPQGQEGLPGEVGPVGPPFANAVVDGVTTLDPAEAATVQTSFDGTSVHFEFGIPRGNDGSAGADGAPGEISQSQLDTAISGTSANTNGVATLDDVFADPEMEALRQKLNETILNGRR